VLLFIYLYPLFYYAVCPPTICYACHLISFCFPAILILYSTLLQLTTSILEPSYAYIISLLPCASLSPLSISLKLLELLCSCSFSLFIVWAVILIIFQASPLGISMRCVNQIAFYSMTQACHFHNSTSLSKLLLDSITLLILSILLHPFLEYFFISYTPAVGLNTTSIF